VIYRLGESAECRLFWPLPHGAILLESGISNQAQSIREELFVFSLESIVA
jgi:hypothetical protein